MWFKRPHLEGGFLRGRALDNPGQGGRSAHEGNQARDEQKPTRSAQTVSRPHHHTGPPPAHTTTTTHHTHPLLPLPPPLLPSPATFWASLRSEGRREVTAASGTPQGTASQPSACRYWLGRWESKWTPPHFASSQPLRWKPRGSWKRRRRSGGGSRPQKTKQGWSSARCSPCSVAPHGRARAQTRC